MPWYYAGPDEKPVGPVSLDELHATRASGVLKPETYVIEHTGAPGPGWSWKRYQDLFPPALSPAAPPPAFILPPPPSAEPTPAAPPIATPLPAAATHPLFPSAGTMPAPPVGYHPPRHLDPYYAVKPTNACCAWGFGLGLGGFFFSFACGAGLLLALPAFLICIIGLAQLRHRTEQGGRGLAVCGLALSTVGLIVSLIFIISIAVPMIKAHELTITEQTSNDSE